MGKPSLLILPGDGIGPEVMVEVRKVIEWFTINRGLEFDVTEDFVGVLLMMHMVPLSMMIL